MADRELKWDDEIDNDDGGWTLLEAGEYGFRVTGFERKRFGGSYKLPPCSQAALTLEVGSTATGKTTLVENLFLHSVTEGLLCAFFRAIGARKHGERMAMDWGSVVGKSGRCLIGIREWTGRDGEKKQSNEVKKFLDPGDDVIVAPEPAAPAAPKAPAATDDIPF